MKGKNTGFIPACFSFFLRYSRLRMKYVKADSLSQTFCQLAISSLPLIPFYAIFNILFVFSPIVHLLVRDESNRRQMYEEVFKQPKNYGIIFEKQAKLLLCIG